MKTNNNYNELVDHLVSTMPTSSPTDTQLSVKVSAPFYTHAYQNYTAQVYNQREIYS